MCTFLLTPTPTRAYQRVKPGDAVINSLDNLLALQYQIECDIYISMPDEYGQRRVMFLDPL